MCNGYKCEECPELYRCNDRNALIHQIRSEFDKLYDKKRDYIIRALRKDFFLLDVKPMWNDEKAEYNTDCSYTILNQTIRQYKCVMA